ncbi:MAG: copper chaperone PCu(A)C [Hyphomonas sp.]
MRLAMSLVAGLAALTLSACTPASDPAGNAPAEAGQPAAVILALSNGEVFIPPGERNVTAAFGTFTAGDQQVLLVAAKADFAEAIEFHTHEMGEDGRMAMRQVDGFLVPARGEHVLKRGGDHLMLFGVDRAALVPGAELSVTITVRLPDETTEEVVLPLTVKDL